MQLIPCLFVSQSRVGPKGFKCVGRYEEFFKHSFFFFLAISQGYKVLPKEVIIIMINHCIDFEGWGFHE